MSTQEPREIAFEDIKKGDDIEARHTRDGVAYTRRGVAHSMSLDCWLTESGGAVAWIDGGWKHFLHARPAPAEPEGLGAVIRWRKWEYVATNSTPGTQRWAWVNEDGDDDRVTVLRWDEFVPDSIEVLSEGIEVES